MTTPNTPARLAYILAHPRVRGLRPGWYWPTCEKCGDDCTPSTAPERDNAMVWICMDCKRDVDAPIYKFAPATEGDNPSVIFHGDLAHPDNLGKLLALADEVNGKPVNLDWLHADAAYFCFARPYNTLQAYGPTRSAAVINALYRALGGEG